MTLRALIQELDLAVGHGSAERRTEIVERLSEVFVAGAAAYSDQQIELFDSVFVRIVDAIEGSARAALANRLAGVPRAPTRISHRLAADDDIAVAGPVLTHSQRLDLDYLVTAARTKSQQHLLAISKRTPLAEPVTDVLVERGDKPVILSAASNPAARFSNAGYRTLVSRSAGDDELTTCVALRADIPRPHLLRLLVRASHEVQRKLAAEHPQLADTIQQAVSAAAARILDTQTRDFDAARARVETLLAAGKLGENDVSAFATANKFEETIAALAALSGLPIGVVERAMVQARPEAVLVMAKAIDMSWPTAKAILRLRAGSRGISPGELEECAETYARLNTSTVRQIVDFQKKRAHTTRFGRTAA